MSKTGVRLWILVVCGLISALGVFVGVSLYSLPEPFLPGVDLKAPGVPFLLQMWAARQIAIAGMLGFSVIRRSSLMLQTVLGIYAVMNVQDAMVGSLNQDLGLAGGAGFFAVLAIVLIWRLRARA